MLTEKLRTYNRYQAALGHFGLSAAALIALLAIMNFIWFPYSLFLYEGGLQGLKILIPVDLVLGPVLTLVVFNPKKEKLFFDLGCIFTFQIAAIAWGVMQIHSIRPHAIVYDSGTFFSVGKSSFELNIDNDVPAGLMPLKSWYQRTPLISLSPPKDEDEKVKREIAKSLHGILGTGPHIDFMTYEPFFAIKDNQPLSKEEASEFVKSHAIQPNLSVYNAEMYHLEGYAIYDNISHSLVRFIPKKPITLLELIQL